MQIGELSAASALHVYNNIYTFHSSSVDLGPRNGFTHAQFEGDKKYTSQSILDLNSGCEIIFSPCVSLTDLPPPPPLCSPLVMVMLG